MESACHRAVRRALAASCNTELGEIILLAEHFLDHALVSVRHVGGRGGPAQQIEGEIALRDLLRTEAARSAGLRRVVRSPKEDVVRRGAGLFADAHDDVHREALAPPLDHPHILAGDADQLSELRARKIEVFADRLDAAPDAVHHFNHATAPVDFVKSRAELTRIACILDNPMI